MYARSKNNVVRNIAKSSFNNLKALEKSLVKKYCPDSKNLCIKYSTNIYSLKGICPVNEYTFTTPILVLPLPLPKDILGFINQINQFFKDVFIIDRFVNKCVNECGMYTAYNFLIMNLKSVYTSRINSIIDEEYKDDEDKALSLKHIIETSSEALEAIKRFQVNNLLL